MCRRLKRLRLSGSSGEPSALHASRSAVDSSERPISGESAIGWQSFDCDSAHASSEPKWERGLEEQFDIFDGTARPAPATTYENVNRTFYRVSFIRLGLRDFSLSSISFSPVRAPRRGRFVNKLTALRNYYVHG